VISLVIIAKHSAKSYQKLVDVASTYVDEIVTVVDVGAEGGIMGYRPEVVRYYERPLAGDFAAQRNFACDKARHEWILHLDTDETLAATLWRELELILSDIEADLVMLPRINLFVGDDVAVNWPDWQPKLHRSHVRWALPVHEWPYNFEKAHRLPCSEAFAIVHVKTKEQQIVADRLYDEIRIATS
jgi:hypothetical protein